MTSKLHKTPPIIFLSLILFLSIVLRFYHLGINPPSLTWDEASLGYNAYSILKTGRDEYGTFLPLSIRSFDDYKPPLYVYLTIPSIAVFGLNEFAVRFPSAVLGTLGVVVMYFMVKEIFQRWNSTIKEYIALISAFFLAVSPWQLQFSRAAFEGNVGLFFLMTGIWLLLVGLRKKYFLFFSSASFIFALYSYHSFRVLIPFLLFSFVMLFYRDLLKIKKIAATALVTFILFSFPVYMNFVSSSAGSSSRLSMVTIFSSEELIKKSIDRIEYDRTIGYSLGNLFDNRRVVYFLAGVKGYLDHFDPDFLFVRGDGGVQHHPVDFGMLYLFDIPFLFIGVYSMILRRDKFIILVFILLFLSPLAASITTGTPHPVRAITMLVPLHIITAVGLIFVFLKLKQMKNRTFYAGLTVLIVGTFVLNFAYYLNQYYIHTPREYGYFWQFGNKEALAYAKENEHKYDKIIVTFKYDQPYIYYLFHNAIDPSWYQSNWDISKTGLNDRFYRKIGKYEFKNIDYAKDSQTQKTLIIGTPDEIPFEETPVQEVYFPDGNIAYKIVSI